MNTLILEQTERGDVVFDVYQKLAHDRVLFINDFIDDKIATDICATLMLKNFEDPTLKISLLINADGGNIRSVFTIYDTMMLIDAPIETMCVGSAMEEAVLLLAAGTKGMRYATKNSVICPSQLLHDASYQTDLTDAKSLLDKVKHDNKQFITILSKCVGKTYSSLMKDLERKKFMNANQAQKYGIIDCVMEGKKNA